MKDEKWLYHVEKANHVDSSRFEKHSLVICQFLLLIQIVMLDNRLQLKLLKQYLIFVADHDQ